MKLIARRLERQYPDSNSGWGISVAPMIEQVVSEARPALLVFAGAVGFVLLIACGNVAALLLVRGLQRQQEYAVRSALGVGRAGLLRQVSAEGLLLAVLGGALGVGLAFGVVKLFKLIGEALDHLSPARLGYTHARAGFAMNRRLPTPKGYQNSPYPDGPVDQSVPVLRVEGLDRPVCAKR